MWKKKKKQSLYVDAKTVDAIRAMKNLHFAPPYTGSYNSSPYTMTEAQKIYWKQWLQRETSRYKSEPKDIMNNPHKIEAPKIQGPFLGFRGWKIARPEDKLDIWGKMPIKQKDSESYRLRSVAHDYLWPRGVIEAKCNKFDHANVIRIAEGVHRKFDPYVYGQVPRADEFEEEILRKEDHVVPHPSCNCGNYSYFSPNGLITGGHGEQVIGAVSNWGDIQVHRDGMRSEFAQIKILAAPLFLKGSPQMQQISDYYEADVIYDHPRYLTLRLFAEAIKIGNLFPEDEINKIVEMQRVEEERKQKAIAEARKLAKRRKKQYMKKSTNATFPQAYSSWNSKSMDDIKKMYAEARKEAKRAELRNTWRKS